MNKQLVDLFRKRAVFASSLVLLAATMISCSGNPAPTFSQTPPPVNPVGPNLTLVSSDPYTVGPGQHATEVEPHVVAFGSTLVAAFQTGRIAPGGATNIGWATSTDGGTTWTHGFLPGLTIGEGSGPYDAASDPAVAYDAKHQVWMISALPLGNTAPAVTVSRSQDGGLTWLGPVSVDPSAANSDKNWIVCDNTATSPFYGNCYIQWDDPGNGDQIFMNTSSDGGQTWGASKPTGGFAGGIGGQPLVQPHGTVVVPILANSMDAFRSSDGGETWSSLSPITSSVQVHADAGGIRSGPLPSAAMDGVGNIWVVWEDCRFRSSCSTNDLVYSTSADGLNWSAVARVPIDDVTTSVDYFIPGIGIDPLTSGAGAHVGIHYYYYSQSNCTASNCQLNVGFISSANGGTSWNAPVTVAGPMVLASLPNSQNGLMVGDYIATAFTNGVPHGVFAVASAKSGSNFNEAMYTAQGLKVAVEGRQLSSKSDRPLHKLSDKIERERPEKGVIPPRLRRARKSAK